MKLSMREAHILDLLSRGLTNKAIAQQLDISPNTVRDRIGAMCIRFHARTRTALVAIYLHKTAVLVRRPHGARAQRHLTHEEVEHHPINM